jgi:hypothetical protein
MNMNMNIHILVFCFDIQAPVRIFLFLFICQAMPGYVACYSMHHTPKQPGEGSWRMRGERETPEGKRTELTKRNNSTKDTPRDAVTNVFRLHLHIFANKTFKMKTQVAYTCRYYIVLFTWSMQKKRKAEWRI